MTGEHRRLCRIILRGVMIALIVAGALAQRVAADPHRAAPPSPGTSARLAGTPGDRFILKRLLQIDTVVIKPGTRDALEPNAPNPFGPSDEVSFWFSIAQPGLVRLKIYDFFYNPVMTLFDGTVDTPGRRRILFRAPASMPSGMYFYELKTDRYYEIRRMIYVK